MDSCKANLVLGNFAKKLGFGQTPPLVGPKDQLFPFFNFEGSPNDKRLIFWTKKVKSLLNVFPQAN